MRNNTLAGFLGRFLALWLILALACPAPAFSLRESQEGTAELQLPAALRSGLEELPASIRGQILTACRLANETMLSANQTLAFPWDSGHTRLFVMSDWRDSEESPADSLMIYMGDLPVFRPLAPDPSTFRPEVREKTLRAKGWFVHELTRSAIDRVDREGPTGQLNDAVKRLFRPGAPSDRKLLSEVLEKGRAALTQGEDRQGGPPQPEEAFRTIKEEARESLQTLLLLKRPLFLLERQGLGEKVEVEVARQSLDPLVRQESQWPFSSAQIRFFLKALPPGQPVRTEKIRICFKQLEGERRLAGRNRLALRLTASDFRAAYYPAYREALREEWDLLDRAFQEIQGQDQPMEDLAGRIRVAAEEILFLEKEAALTEVLRIQAMPLRDQTERPGKDPTYSGGVLWVRAGKPERFVPGGGSALGAVCASYFQPARLREWHRPGEEVYFVFNALTGAPIPDQLLSYFASAAHLRPAVEDLAACGLAVSDGENLRLYQPRALLKDEAAWRGLYDRLAEVLTVFVQTRGEINRNLLAGDAGWFRGLVRDKSRRFWNELDQAWKKALPGQAQEIMQVVRGRLGQRVQALSPSDDPKKLLRMVEEIVVDANRLAGEVIGASLLGESFEEVSIPGVTDVAPSAVEPGAPLARAVVEAARQAEAGTLTRNVITFFGSPKDVEVVEVVFNWADSGAEGAHFLLVEGSTHPFSYPLLPGPENLPEKVAQTCLQENGAHLSRLDRDMGNRLVARAPLDKLFRAIQESLRWRTYPGPEAIRGFAGSIRETLLGKSQNRRPPADELHDLRGLTTEQERPEWDRTASQVEEMVEVLAELRTVLWEPVLPLMRVYEDGGSKEGAQVPMAALRGAFDATRRERLSRWGWLSAQLDAFLKREDSMQSVHGFRMDLAQMEEDPRAQLRAELAAKAPGRLLRQVFYPAYRLALLKRLEKAEEKLKQADLSRQNEDAVELEMRLLAEEAMAIEVEEAYSREIRINIYPPRPPGKGPRARATAAAGVLIRKAEEPDRFIPGGGSLHTVDTLAYFSPDRMAGWLGAGRRVDFIYNTLTGVPGMDQMRTYVPSANHLRAVAPSLAVAGIGTVAQGRVRLYRPKAALDDPRGWAEISEAIAQGWLTYQTFFKAARRQLYDLSRLHNLTRDKGKRLLSEYGDLVRQVLPQREDEIMAKIDDYLGKEISQLEGYMKKDDARLLIETGKVLGNAIRLFGEVLAAQIIAQYFEEETVEGLTGQIIPAAQASPADSAEIPGPAAPAEGLLPFALPIPEETPLDALPAAVRPIVALTREGLSRRIGPNALSVDNNDPQWANVRIRMNWEGLDEYPGGMVLLPWGEPYFNPLLPDPDRLPADVIEGRQGVVRRISMADAEQLINRDKAAQRLARLLESLMSDEEGEIKKLRAERKHSRGTPATSGELLGAVREVLAQRAKISAPEEEAEIREAADDLRALWTDLIRFDRLRDEMKREIGEASRNGMAPCRIIRAAMRKLLAEAAETPLNTAEVRHLLESLESYDGDRPTKVLEALEIVKFFYEEASVYHKHACLTRVGFRRFRRLYGDIGRSVFSEEAEKIRTQGEPLEPARWLAAAVLHLELEAVLAGLIQSSVRRPKENSPDAEYPFETNGPGLLRLDENDRPEAFLPGAGRLDSHLIGGIYYAPDWFAAWTRPGRRLALGCNSRTGFPKIEQLQYYLAMVETVKRLDPNSPLPWLAVSTPAGVKLLKPKAEWTHPGGLLRWYALLTSRVPAWQRFLKKLDGTILSGTSSKARVVAGGAFMEFLGEAVSAGYGGDERLVKMILGTVQLHLRKPLEELKEINRRYPSDQQFQSRVGPALTQVAVSARGLVGEVCVADQMGEWFEEVQVDWEHPVQPLMTPPPAQAPPEQAVGPEPGTTAPLAAAAKPRQGDSNSLEEAARSSLVLLKSLAQRHGYEGRWVDRKLWEWARERIRTHRKKNRPPANEWRPDPQRMKEFLDAVAASRLKEAQELARLIEKAAGKEALSALGDQVQRLDDDKTNGAYQEKHRGFERRQLASEAAQAAAGLFPGWRSEDGLRDICLGLLEVHPDWAVGDLLAELKSQKQAWDADAKTRQKQREDDRVRQWVQAAQEKPLSSTWNFTDDRLNELARAYYAASPEADSNAFCQFLDAEHIRKAEAAVQQRGAAFLGAAGKAQQERGWDFDATRLDRELVAFVAGRPEASEQDFVEYLEEKWKADQLSRRQTALTARARKAQAESGWTFGDGELSTAALALLEGQPQATEDQFLARLKDLHLEKQARDLVRLAQLNRANAGWNFGDDRFRKEADALLKGNPRARYSDFERHLNEARQREEQEKQDRRLALKRNLETAMTKDAMEAIREPAGEFDDLTEAWHERITLIPWIQEAVEARDREELPNDLTNDRIVQEAARWAQGNPAMAVNEDTLASFIGQLNRQLKQEHRKAIDTQARAMVQTASVLAADKGWVFDGDATKALETLAERFLTDINPAGDVEAFIHHVEDLQSKRLEKERSAAREVLIGEIKVWLKEKGWLFEGLDVASEARAIFAGRPDAVSSDLQERFRVLYQAEQDRLKAQNQAVLAQGGAALIKIKGWNVSETQLGEIVEALLKEDPKAEVRHLQPLLEKRHLENTLWLLVEAAEHEREMEGWILDPAAFEKQAADFLKKNPQGTPKQFVAELRKANAGKVKEQERLQAALRSRRVMQLMKEWSSHPSSKQWKIPYDQAVEAANRLVAGKLESTLEDLLAELEPATPKQVNELVQAWNQTANQAVNAGDPLSMILPANELLDVGMWFALEHDGEDLDHHLNFLKSEKGKDRPAVLKESAEGYDAKAVNQWTARNRYTQMIENFMKRFGKDVFKVNKTSDKSWKLPTYDEFKREMAQAKKGTEPDPVEAITGYLDPLNRHLHACNQLDLLNGLKPLLAGRQRIVEARELTTQLASVLAEKWNPGGAQAGLLQPAEAQETGPGPGDVLESQVAKWALEANGHRWTKRQLDALRSAGVQWMQAHPWYPPALLFTNLELAEREAGLSPDRVLQVLGEALRRQAENPKTIRKVLQREDHLSEVVNERMDAVPADAPAAGLEEVGRVDTIGNSRRGLPIKLAWVEPGNAEGLSGKVWVGNKEAGEVSALISDETLYLSWIRIGKKAEPDVQDPERGQGVGTAVVKRLIQEAVHRGAKKISVQVRNPRLMRILYKSGFLDTGEATVVDRRSTSEQVLFSLDDFYRAYDVDDSNLWPARDYSVDWLLTGKLADDAPASPGAGLEEKGRAVLSKLMECSKKVTEGSMDGWALQRWLGELAQDRLFDDISLKSAARYRLRQILQGFWGEIAFQIKYPQSSSRKKMADHLIQIWSELKRLFEDGAWGLEGQEELSPEEWDSLLAVQDAHFGLFKPRGERDHIASKLAKQGIYLPTDPFLAVRLLKRAEVKPAPGQVKIRLLDLGLGKGDVVIPAAGVLGAQVYGYELDDELITSAKAWLKAVQDQGLVSEGQAKFLQKDFLDPAVKWPKVDLIYYYWKGAASRGLLEERLRNYGAAHPVKLVVNLHATDAKPDHVFSDLDQKNSWDVREIWEQNKPLALVFTSPAHPEHSSNRSGLEEARRVEALVALERAADEAGVPAGDSSEKAEEVRAHGGML